ncbi:MAG: hypothetical protein MAG715_00651 [Methanonatronarchaeales archaeon]|nr:hypothetical protein [Methanonatronarchaeales archaeon]
MEKAGLVALDSYKNDPGIRLTEVGSRIKDAMIKLLLNAEGPFYLRDFVFRVSCRVAGEERFIEEMDEALEEQGRAWEEAEKAIEEGDEEAAWAWLNRAESLSHVEF